MKNLLIFRKKFNSYKNFEEFLGNLFEMNGYNLALFSEKSQDIQYDVTFDHGKLDVFCKFLYNFFISL